MQRILNPQSTVRIRGNSPAFAAGYGRQANFKAPVAQLLERDASNVGDEGESPSGSANLGRVSPTTRGAPLRTERLGVELPHAAPAFAKATAGGPAAFLSGPGRRSARRIGGPRSPGQRRSAGAILPRASASLCELWRTSHFWPASIKVMQRSFKPLNGER